jgi:Zn-finger nucleic acid-binding protein
MNCPNCQTTLVMTDRQGVEIDHCPQCRGVWLDRGELDKIIERSARFEASAPPRPAPDDRAYRGDDDDDYRHGQYRKRKSFWSELFD